jgi:hypothetical protein
MNNKEKAKETLKIGYRKASFSNYLLLIKYWPKKVVVFFFYFTN